MLQVNQLCGFAPVAEDNTFISVIQRLGLLSNLQLCLDAGDAASYPGSGQKWLDRSGNGYDFFLGADGSAGASDPTFVGSAGSPSAYWSFDSGDYFTYDTTNETWMQNLHKNNAVFTIIAFFYQGGNNITNSFIGDVGIGPIGFGFYTSSDEAPQINVVDTITVLNVSGTPLGLNAYHMVGISLTEATGVGGGFFYSDGAYNQSSGSDTFNSTYTSPSTSNASNTMQISALGTGVTPTLIGARLACLAVWTSALSKANMDTIWAAMRGRFGI